MSIEKAGFIREQYATEHRLRARKSVPPLGESSSVRRHSTVFVAQRAS